MRLWKLTRKQHHYPGTSPSKTMLKNCLWRKSHRGLLWDKASFSRWTQTRTQSLTLTLQSHSGKTKNQMRFSTLIWSHRRKTICRKVSKTCQAAIKTPVVRLIRVLQRRRTPNHWMTLKGKCCTIPLARMAPLRSPQPTTKVKMTSSTPQFWRFSQTRSSTHSHIVWAIGIYGSLPD